MRLMMMLSIAMSAMTLDAMAVQAGKQGAEGKPAVGACSILTTDLVTVHSPASSETLNVILKAPPREEKIGATGSSCKHGDVMLQINPFPLANFEPMFGRWTAVPGVGERAYFRDNRGEWAELAVRAGGRMITVQMDVPRGRTASSIQANTVSLAKAVLAKLK
jgi:hypothetical protein